MTIGEYKADDYNNDILFFNIFDKVIKDNYDAYPLLNNNTSRIHYYIDNGIILGNPESEMYQSRKH